MTEMSGMSGGGLQRGGKSMGQWARSVRGRGCCDSIERKGKESRGLLEDVWRISTGCVNLPRRGGWRSVWRPEGRRCRDPWWFRSR